MSRKKHESKKIFENMPVEPDEVPHGTSNAAVPADETSTPLTEAEQAESEAPALEQAADKSEETAPNADESAAESSNPESDEVSPDDLLEDVRRSLIQEEESRDKEQQPKWWKRIGRSSRKNTPEQETPKAVEEINLPNLETELTAPVGKQEPEPEEYVDDIDELIDLLETEEAEEKKPAVAEAPPPEPEKVIDLEELKKQAFQPRQTAETEQSLSEVRSIALEGDEEVFVEVQSTPQNPLEERISAVENALTPYRRYINFVIAFLGLVMAIVAGAVLFNIYKQSVAAAAPTEVPSDLPFPTSVSLPGGWTFKLAKGRLLDGNWNPQGAEWLQGTEVCRWVALPWSKQLEAVIRTLNPDDPIQLGMSNNDMLTYKVYSIKQMSPAEMQELDSNTPCLLIVLVEPDAEQRWVLTSLP
jgi:AAA ATPase containing von Willebrand factor type A (vWA) domain